MKGFNTHNKSAYFYDFWWSCNTGEMILKIQHYITEINSILEYIKIRNGY